MEAPEFMEDEDAFLQAVTPETLTRPPYNHRPANSAAQPQVLRLGGLAAESSTDGESYLDDDTDEDELAAADRLLAVSRPNGLHLDGAFNTPPGGGRRRPMDDPNEHSPNVEAHEDLQHHLQTTAPHHVVEQLAHQPRRAVSPFPPDNITPDEFVQQLTHNIAMSPIATVGVRQRTLTFSGSTADDDDDDLDDEYDDDEYDAAPAGAAEEAFVPMQRAVVSMDGTGIKILLGSQEDLRLGTETDTDDAPVVPATPVPAPTMRDDADVSLSGRVGHAVFINGSYMRVPNKLHDNRPVYCHIDPIPEGFAEASGKD